MKIFNCFKLSLLATGLQKKVLVSFTCFIVFSCCMNLYAQSSKIDSLKKLIQLAKAPSDKACLLAELSLKTSYYNTDSALLIVKQGLQLGISAKNDSAIARCKWVLGIIYFQLAKEDSGEYFMLQAQALFHQLKDDRREATVLFYLGAYYLDRNEALKAVSSLTAAERIAESINDSISLGKIGGRLGNAYAMQGFFNEGKQYARTAIAIFKNLNNMRLLAEAYSYYAYIFMKEENYDSALYYFRVESKMDQDNHHFVTEEGIAADFANVFYHLALKTGDSRWADSAYTYYLISLKYVREELSEFDVKLEYIHLGSALRIMKKYKPAQQYLTGAFHFFDSIANANNAYLAADELSTLYKEINDYKNAYTYKLIGLKYKDTVDKINSADSITKIFARYETDKKEKQIQLLNAQSALDKSTLSRQRIIVTSSMISLALAVGLFIVLINRNRMKQQLKEVKVRNQLAGDLHDEVGSSLSSILLLSKMASGNAATQTADKGMLETIAANTKDVMNKMNDIVWMMNPKYDEGENVREKLEQYVSNIQEATIAVLQLHVAANIDAIKFPMEIRKTILLVCKEAVNNALKYANASVIKISLSTENNYVHFIVSDKGKGFDMNVVKEGNGLGTMNLRAKESNGKLIIQSSPGNGTQVKLIFPVPHSR
jgi:signal transduction histidine kinase